MKLFIYTILSVLVIVTSVPLDAQDIIGKVIDKSTKKGLSFVQIGVVDKPFGTLTDEQGTFKINQKIVSSIDTISIHSLGYKTLVLSVDSLLKMTNREIPLTKETYQLPKIEISVNPLINDRKLGYPKTTSKRLTAGWKSTPTENYQKSLGERGTLIKLNGKTALLKNLYFHLYNYGYDSLLFRIHLYNLKNNEPAQELVTDDIIIKTTKRKGWVEVPLEELNIIVEEDFVATIEWLKAWTTKKNKNLGMVLSSGILKGKLYARFFPHLKSNWIIRKNWHVGIYITAKTN